MNIVKAAGWLLLMATLTPETIVEAQSLGDLRRESRDGGTFHRSGGAELRRAGDLFALLFAGGVEYRELDAAWQALGFDLLEVEDEGLSLLVLKEKKCRREGRGFYAFRRRGGEPVALQAPHSFFDNGTGKIVERFFRDGRAVAAAWNSLSRQSKTGGVATDLAHVEKSYLQEFTLAFCNRYRNGWIVQVHGFRSDKRVTEAGRAARMILSDGTRSPGRWIKELKACLEERFLREPLVFPDDVSELGATTNAQGRLARRIGRGRFVHMELSEQTRTRLLKDESARGHFLNCLSGR